MDVYVYQAALLCDECGIKRQHALTTPLDPDDESTWDSGDYPKGPYPDGGGEADCPQHCDDCGCFLYNDLTSDGVQYVMDALESFIMDGRGDEPTLIQWLANYDNDTDELYCMVRGLIRLRGLAERKKDLLAV